MNKDLLLYYISFACAVFLSACHVHNQERGNINNRNLDRKLTRDNEKNHSLAKMRNYDDPCGSRIPTTDEAFISTMQVDKEVIEAASEDDIAFQDYCNKTVPKTNMLWSNIDDWYCEPSEEISGMEMPSSDGIVKVKPKYLNEAITALLRMPFRKVTKDEASKFTGCVNIDADKEKEPYLMRGVYLCQGGKYSYVVRDSKVYIYNICMGNWKAPMKKWPVIIWLEAEPTKVYCMCTMVS